MHADSFASALSGIYSSIRRIEEMIERTERYEAIANMKVEYREVNIRRLVMEMIESLPGHIDAAIEGDLEVAAFSDERHIRDAFQRIVENAIETGSERIEIRLEHRDGYAYVSIRDYGPGIEGDAETLFAPSTRRTREGRTRPGRGQNRHGQDRLIHRGCAPSMPGLYSS